MILAVEKIEFAMFGLDLVEPNTLITDGILGLLSMFLGLKIGQLAAPQNFFRNWQRFLLIFGLGAFLGGLGHVFYNYLGIAGKVPAWVLGIISVYFIEYSMISIHPEKRMITILTRISSIKLIILLGSVMLVLASGDPGNKENLCIVLVILNSLLGVTLSAGLLGLHYYRLGISENYGFLVLGVMVMLPSSAVFLMDINLYQWFDKNDLSHLLLAIGIIIFYMGLVRLHYQEPDILFEE